MIKKIFFFIFSGALLMSSTTALADTQSAVISPVSQSISSNWAGYVSSMANSYSEVGGSWVVPIPSNATTTRLAMDATWVGIGGVKSTDLIQAGTQAIIQNGEVVYSAWFETLPDYQKVIPLTIRGGDSVSVSLKETTTDVWHLTFLDITTGQSFENDIQYHSSHSSAEWIEEMPLAVSSRSTFSLPLDEFGTVTFSNAYAVASGVRQSILSLGAASVTMATRLGELLASPSALSENSFSVTRAVVASTVTPQMVYQNQRMRRGQFRNRVVVIFSLR